MFSMASMIACCSCEKGVSKVLFRMVAMLFHSRTIGAFAFFFSSALSKTHRVILWREMNISVDGDSMGCALGGSVDLSH